MRNRGALLATWIGSILVIACTLAGLAALGWWKYQQIIAAQSTPPPPEMPTVVGLRQVGTVAWRNSTSSIGTILAPRSITVNNELPGTVSSVTFQPGSLVETGQVLLQQDTSVELAQLKAAEAREAFTRSTLERNRSMAQTDAVTRIELEELQSQWEQARSQVEELKAVIRRKTISAPFRGRVGLSDTHEGQYLAAGSLITTLQSVEDHLLVDFTLPQAVANQIQNGEIVQVKAGTANLQASIVALDAQADRNTRNVRVRARIDQPPANLQPGDSVQVRTSFGAEIVLPGVPADAVRRSPQGSFVFVAETNDKGELRASARPVMPATSAGKMIGLSSGVTTGETVAVEGSFKLQDGMLIAPPPDPAAAAAMGAGQPPATPQPSAANTEAAADAGAAADAAPSGAAAERKEEGSRKP